MKKQCSIQTVLRDIEKEPVREAVVENRLGRFRAGEAYKIWQKNGNEAVVFIQEDYYFETYVLHITTHFNDRECDFWDEEEEYY
ncbi:unnamed protein product [Caenorhabditis brenneri]